MKLYIPRVGSCIKLTSNVEVSVIPEHRNTALMKASKMRTNDRWSLPKQPRGKYTLEANTYLVVTRVYIRTTSKAGTDSDYDSLTFVVALTDSKSLPAGSKFFLRLDDVNKLEIDFVGEGYPAGVSAGNQIKTELAGLTFQKKEKTSLDLGQRNHRHNTLSNLILTYSYSFSKLNSNSPIFEIIEMTKDDPKIVAFLKAREAEAKQSFDYQNRQALSSNEIIRSLKDHYEEGGLDTINNAFKNLNSYKKEKKQFVFDLKENLSQGLYLHTAFSGKYEKFENLNLAKQECVISLGHRSNVEFPAKVTFDMKTGQTVGAVIMVGVNRDIPFVVGNPEIP